MQCSFCSNKFDPFLDLSLEIVKADSVQKALAHFTTKEQLDGGAKQYHCQQCKQKVRALKQLTVHKAPHVLTVHLKRFSSHSPGQKIDKKIVFGPTLDMKPFVTGPYVSVTDIFSLCFRMCVVNVVNRCSSLMPSYLFFNVFYHSCSLLFIFVGVFPSEMQ